MGVDGAVCGGGSGWWWGAEEVVIFELEELKDEKERPACEDLGVNPFQEEGMSRCKCSEAGKLAFWVERKRPMWQEETA